MSRSREWPALPSYEEWSDTCDTLHAHTQVLGKLAARLAPPEPQLQHAALRLGVRGWETLPLPAPDGSGMLAVELDLCAHEAVARHTDGRSARVPLAPDHPVGAVTRELLAAVRSLGGAVEIDPAPQETPWQTPLDEDDEHAAYDPGRVARYFAAASRAARARSRGTARALPGALDPRQRLVGVVRPRGQPLLGRARGGACRGLHHP